MAGKDDDMKMDNDETGASRRAAEEPPELELSDEDILDAMSRIPGYIDISTPTSCAAFRRTVSSICCCA